MLRFLLVSGVEAIIGLLATAAFIFLVTPGPLRDVAIIVVWIVLSVGATWLLFAWLREDADTLRIDQVRDVIAEAFPRRELPLALVSGQDNPLEHPLNATEYRDALKTLAAL